MKLRGDAYESAFAKKKKRKMKKKLYLNSPDILFLMLRKLLFQTQPLSIFAHAVSL